MILTIGIFFNLAFLNKQTIIHMCNLSCGASKMEHLIFLFISKDDKCFNSIVFFFFDENLQVESFINLQCRCDIFQNIFPNTRMHIY